MKPLKLVMSAFGSYAGEEVVDFSKAGNGVFLITGNTGAGKTTIFDAMVYALYDRTSGGERSGNMMRSQFANPQTSTYVRFTFSVRGEIYTVYRNPDYYIKKQLKNGKIKEQKVIKSVELTLPNQEIYPEKKAQTDTKIEEILGLDAVQFTQTVMLAQGDFLKLLYTKSDNRKIILSKIFKTSLYYWIEEELKRRAFHAQEALDDCKKAMWQELSNARFDIECEADTEQLAECIKRQKEQEKEQLQKKKENAKKLEELSAKLSVQEQINAQFAQLKKTEEQLNALSAKKKILAEQEQAVTQKLSEQEEPLQKEIAELERSLPIYEQIQKGKEKEEGAKKRLEEIAQDTGVFGKEKEKVNKSRACWERQIEIAKRAGEIYEEIYQNFFKEQAGILASQLKKNEPCPVCGSVEHPHPAKVTEQAPTQEMVEKSKQDRACAEADRERLGAEFLARKEQYENLKREEETKAKILLAEAKKELEISRKELLYQSEKEAKQALRDRKASLEKLQKEASHAKELKKQCEEKEQLYLGQREQLLKNTKNQKEEDIQKARELKQEWTKKLRDSENELQKIHTALEINQQIYRNLEKYQKTYARLREEAAVIDTLNRTASGKISGSAKIDFETYMQRKYFRLILAEANKRLIKMNRGGFLLQLKESENVGKGKNEGLDLEVYSMMTNSIRDIKTLSGGESFLAALSMALGLSDIVQKMAGAVQLDVMFIDEGFGTLDEMSRQQAVEVLQELAGENRQVGIISHVSELKEQLDKKLIVEKGESGSSIRWEM